MMHGPIYVRSGKFVLITSSLKMKKKHGALVKGTDKVKPKNSEYSLSQYDFIHHKSHMDWPVTNR